MRQSESSVDRRGTIFDRCDAKECRSHKHTTQTELLLITHGLKRRLQDGNKVRDAEFASLRPASIYSIFIYFFNDLTCLSVCVSRVWPSAGR